ncbi:uncharacterized protein K444DRAFT_607429 [Hyaloscypha bicolor E]|uniref:Uncharacterized protein n=1 Tax=Hyaloscypha bicolor E TaxID=1095630 RepID=A0A2J6TSM4_9HELO|nr:uncharacterized protein K444DRAFT_607429 [Hyaloscypha bicolor E]PMD66010.1 hypothetical protein K444DRAFT_607429 [Hyaloscypha bicolor E]
MVTFMTQRPHHLRSLALLSLPDSQKTTQSWDSRNGPRPQIEESQPTQSWDSRDLPPDSLEIPSPPLFVPDSQADSSQELS